MRRSPSNTVPLTLPSTLGSASTTLTPPSGIVKLAIEIISSLSSDCSASGGKRLSRSAAWRADARLICGATKCISVTRPPAGTVTLRQPASSRLGPDVS